MTTTNILLVSQHEQQVNNWMNIVNQHKNWKAVHVETDEEGIEKFHQYHFDVVLLGKSLSEEEIKKLTKLFTVQQDEVTLIMDDDNLEEKIQKALNTKNKNKSTFSIIDDALKNAGLNINLQ
jgi:DNA-binding response OmpR family regulator